MSLFSRLRVRGASIPDPIAKSVLAAATLTLISDGDVNDAELAQLSNMCSFSPIFVGVEGAQISALINQIIQDIKEKGADAVINESAAALPQPLRETALAFAMRVALADGRIEDGEKNALSGIAARYEIAPEVFVGMLDVIAMLQRGPQASS